MPAQLSEFAFTQAFSAGLRAARMELYEDLVIAVVALAVAAFSLRVAIRTWRNCGDDEPAVILLLGIAMAGVIVGFAASSEAMELVRNPEWWVFTNLARLK